MCVSAGGGGSCSCITDRDCEGVGRTDTFTARCKPCRGAKYRLDNEYTMDERDRKSCVNGRPASSVVSLALVASKPRNLIMGAAPVL